MDFECVTMKFAIIFVIFTQISMNFGCVSAIKYFNFIKQKYFQKDVNITILSAKNCIKNPVIFLQDNLNIRVTQKCVLLIDTCYDLKPFKKSTVSLEF